MSYVSEDTTDIFSITKDIFQKTRDISQKTTDISQKQGTPSKKQRMFSYKQARSPHGKGLRAGNLCVYQTAITEMQGNG